MNFNKYDKNRRKRNRDYQQVDLYKSKVQPVQVTNNKTIIMSIVT